MKKRARELRAKHTEAERFLWELIRDRQLDDAKFRRNHQFGDHICDFYCHEAKLVIECDGEVHHSPESQVHDRKRDAYMKSQGLMVLRFAHARVLKDTDAVLEEVASHLPSTSGRGAGGEGTKAKPSLELETLVRGVFEPQRFLSLLQHFIVFEEDADTGALHKIIAGYHQFHAVNVAVEETVRASGGTSS